MEGTDHVIAGFRPDPHAHPTACPVEGCENAAQEVGTIQTGTERMKAVRPCSDCQTTSPPPYVDPRTLRRMEPRPSTGYGAVYVLPDWSGSSKPVEPFDRIEFARGFAKLCRRFRRKVDDADLLDGYYQRLRGRVTPGEMRSGIAQAFNAAVVFPTPDELLAMCKGTWRPRRSNWGGWS